MKSIFAYSILAAAVISLSSCTTTSDSFRRESASLTVRSGERTRAGQVWRIHSDCSLADYPPTHIIEQPKHVPGNGFGLSIVNELAGLYGGSLMLDANGAAGLRCVLCLPVTVGSRL